MQKRYNIVVRLGPTGILLPKGKNNKGNNNKGKNNKGNNNKGKNNKLYTWNKMDQVKFVEDSFKKFERVCRGRYIPLNFLKTVFQKFYLFHLWKICLICLNAKNFLVSTTITQNQLRFSDTWSHRSYFQ